LSFRDVDLPLARRQQDRTIVEKAAANLIAYMQACGLQNGLW
jgi:hypothetical protein